MQLEQKIILLARHRLKTLKVMCASKASINKVQQSFYELSGLTSIRLVEESGLSESTAHELVLIDNTAILVVKQVYPEIINCMPYQVQALSDYLEMTDRELVDLIFREGGRFNNHEAISVARHRGLVTSILNETEAYQRVLRREQKQTTAS